MRKVLQAIIRAYQLAISPYLGPTCRFHPSCSNYMLEAISEHGAFRGSWLGIKRLLRCNPWNLGGYDPVPKKCHHLSEQLATHPVRTINTQT